jgi:hypothetical protein
MDHIARETGTNAIAVLYVEAVEHRKNVLSLTLPKSSQLRVKCNWFAEVLVGFFIKEICIVLLMSGQIFLSAAPMGLRSRGVEIRFLVRTIVRTPPSILETVNLPPSSSTLVSSLYPSN